MRHLALVLISLLSFTAAAAQKPRKKPRPVAPAPQAEAPPEATAPVERPAPPPRVAKRAEPETMRVDLGLAGGIFYGGGLNRGPQGSIQVALTPPGWGRFGVDVELGYRLARFQAPGPEGGTVTSSLHSMPLYGVGRFRIVDARSFGLDLRAGLGPQFALHYLSSSFAPSSLRTAVGWDLFAGLQLRFPLGSFEPFLDARLGLGEAYIPFVVGRATGIQGLVGVRYRL